MSQTRGTSGSADTRVIVVDASAGNETVTLPTPNWTTAADHTGEVRVIEVQRTDSNDEATVTVAAGTGVTLDGVSTGTTTLDPGATGQFLAAAGSAAWTSTGTLRGLVAVIDKTCEGRAFGDEIVATSLGETITTRAFTIRNSHSSAITVTVQAVPVHGHSPQPAPATRTIVSGQSISAGATATLTTSLTSLSGGEALVVVASVAAKAVVNYSGWSRKGR